MAPVETRLRAVITQPAPFARATAARSVANVGQPNSSLFAFLSSGPPPELSSPRLAIVWRTSFTLMPFAITSSTWSDASENAMPCRVSARWPLLISMSRQVLTATTSPPFESSGPPLLPGLIAASVCTSTGRLASRRTEDTSPEVSVWRAVCVEASAALSPNSNSEPGWPIAYTG